jgi:ABC-type dipeptide/oligopeptide/nickel transport system permease component
MVEALESMYAKAARARGLPERPVILRHVLVAVETIFAYPGLGRMLDIDDVFYRRQMIYLATVPARIYCPVWLNAAGRE